MVRMESVVAPHPEKTDPMGAATDASWMPAGRQRGADSGPPLRRLDPMALSGHIALLQRAAWALCGSRQEAEDLVQDTFAQVLMRPRLLRSENDVGYLLRALRNTHTTHQRASRRRPITVPLVETDSAHGAELVAGIEARELLAAIAAAPKPYRDVVVAVDIVGLSYRQAARRLRTPEATITSRLSRGRRHVARALGAPANASRPAG
jgi:RNA polymerase sigma-70 factor, ECF subfamily